MLSAIALVAALSRLTTIECPLCKYKKLVPREPKKFRYCPRCRVQFPDPVAEASR